MPLTQLFVSISDPRSVRQVRYDLSELLTVAVCCAVRTNSPTSRQGAHRLAAGLSGARARPPSHDTSGRVFAALNPPEFEATFRRSVVGQLVPALGNDAVVAIEGKTSRRNTTKAAASPLHLVSAFAADIGRSE